MSTIEIKMIVALGLVIALAGWWTYHDHAEQKIGAQACISATTETKADAVTDNTALHLAHADQLRQVVAIYELKLAAAASDNAGLAQRLHADQIRPRTVPAVGGAPGAVCGAGEEPGSTSGTETADDPFGIIPAQQAYFDACDADALELESIKLAWASQVAKRKPFQ